MNYDINSPLRGNLLLAQFEEGIVYAAAQLAKAGGVMGNEEFIKFPINKHGSFIHKTSQLGYHCDWNWLMSIYEKIRTIPLKEITEPWYDICFPYTFGMPDSDGNYMVRIYCCGVHKGKTWIEAAWLAAVEFVGFYLEEQKKNSPAQE